MTHPPSDKPGRAVLTAPAVATFKEDRRSRVWLVEHASQRWVVKRYEHSRAKQVLTSLLGLHPAQMERRRARQLAQAGVPVVPVAAAGWSRGRCWLATPYVGQSMQTAITAGRLRDPQARGPLIAELAARLRELVEAGWYFRDMKTANLVLDAADRAWLIDTGGARRSRQRKHAVRMGAMLARSIRLDGGTRTDCARLLREVIRQLPHLGTKRELTREAVRFDPRIAGEGSF